MPKSSGSERRRGHSRLPLLLLSAATLGSGLLFTSLPAEGLQSVLRVAALLPLQLAALVWVWPRMR
jgi:hypothetical protein